jgi:hypothetical protein
VTLAEFSNIFAMLAVQLRQTDVDEATIRGYYAALRDLDPEPVMWAATEFARAAEWFPKTSEWRQKATELERAATDAMKTRLRALATPLCSLCDDTWMKVVSEHPRRFGRCDCVAVRRLEILGRRPLPALPPAPPAFTEAEALSIKADLEQRIRAAVKSMPSGIPHPHRRLRRRIDSPTIAVDGSEPEERAHAILDAESPDGHK